MTFRPLTAAALAAAAFTLAACGDDESSSGGGGSEAEATPVEFKLEEQGKKATITAPKSVEAGNVEMTFTNSGKKDHSAQLFRIDEGHTTEEALKAGEQWGETGKAALPEWIHLVGGLPTTPGGKSSTAKAQLEPGNYAVVDIDSDAPVLADFEVTGEGGGEAPTAEAKIQAKEYTFTTSGLKAGQNEVLFENTGKQPHHVVGIGIAGDATIEDVKKFFKTEKGKPPIDESKGFSTAVIDGGGKQVVDLDLKPGRYAVLCFIPDREGGPPHAARGMIVEAEVK